MPKEAPPVVKRAQTPEEMLKNKIRGRFNLNAETIQKFQSPGEHDPLRAPDDRTRALLDMVYIFQIYKISVMKLQFDINRNDGVPASDDAEAFAYFDAVQDVVRAMVYGAPYESILPEPPKKSAQNVHEEIRTLIRRMSPPDDNEHASIIQENLGNFVLDLKMSNGRPDLVENNLRNTYEYTKMMIEAQAQEAAEAERKLSIQHPEV